MAEEDNSFIFIAIGILLLLGGGGVAVYEMTRNVRNNNPGNIRYDGTAWQGLANPPSDGSYAIFTTADYGFRALGRIIQNYVSMDGVTPTVTGIISRWAPPSENDTGSYIADVAGQLNVDPNQTLDIQGSLAALALAIANHEGPNNWTISDAQRGTSLS